MNILFVCTGNTCRSPMAEALFRHHSNRNKVKSAGIFANNDVPINDHAFDVLQEKGIEINHRSQEVTEELLNWADLIFPMTTTHQQVLQTQYPAHKEKVHLLKGYYSTEHFSESALNEAGEIADPFGKDLQAYRETLSELDIHITRVINMIESGE